MDLLKKAKSYKPSKQFKKSYSTEEIELAVAWLNDEISLPQLATALGYQVRSNGATTGFLARALRDAYRKRTLVLVPTRHE